MDYQIRGRIQVAGVQGFAAVAIAVPTNGGDSKELQDTCSTRAQAAIRLRALIVELGAMIRREGGQVLDVRTED